MIKKGNSVTRKKDKLALLWMKIVHDWCGAGCTSLRSPKRLVQDTYPCPWLLFSRRWSCRDTEGPMLAGSRLSAHEIKKSTILCAGKRARTNCARELPLTTHESRFFSAWVEVGARRRHGPARLPLAAVLFPSRLRFYLASILFLLSPFPPPATQHGKLQFTAIYEVGCECNH